MAYNSAPRPPPCRAEHVGSLKRPQRLIEAHIAYAEGKLPRQELDELVGAEVGAIVQLQQRLGFKTVTDGEFGRYMFYDGFFDSLEGFEMILNPGPELFTNWLPHYAAFKNGSGEWKPVKTFRATSRIGQSKHTFVKWFNSVKDKVKPGDVKYIKISLVSPEWYHFPMGSNAYSKAAYASDAEYFADVAKAYRGELGALYDAGCRNVQIDSPYFAAFCSGFVRDALAADGIDPDGLLDTYIELVNECVKGKKADMVVGVHLCRGNSKGSHFYEGAYDAIAVRLFNKLNVDCFYLEYDTPRAGGFEPLRHVPQNKTVILGLISTKTPVLEDKERIKGLIDQAAEIMDDPKKERICISPQCGFASRLEGNPVTDEDMEKKLALLAEIAREVWGTTV